MDQDIQQRLTRIKGQVNGIEKMCRSKRDCAQVIQQVIAVRQALASLAREIIRQEVCSLSPRQSQQLDRLAKTLFKVS